MAVSVLGLPLLALVSANVFLNTGLVGLVNSQPERARVTWSRAWMLVPGHVEVRGLEIRVQDQASQWVLTADRADGIVGVAALADRRFSARGVHADGVTFRLRSIRTEARTPDTTPPIPGLTNPPTVLPAALYGPADAPFHVVLDDVVVDGLREVWIEDYRLVGDARATGGLDLRPRERLVLAPTVLDLARGELSVGGAPLVGEAAGRVEVAVAETALADGSASLLRNLSARATLGAQGQDLRFLDFYLRKAPWIALASGGGPLDVDVEIDHGRILDGSRLAVDAKAIVARFLSYTVTGDGSIRFDVAPTDGMSVGTLAVSFFDYAIGREGDAAPHVTGAGLHVGAQTPDLTLSEPFDTLSIVVDLPDSAIPDAGVYNAYLPRDLGFALTSGTGRAHGRLTASTVDDTARGDLTIEGRGVRARLDAVDLTGDVSVHAHLVRGRLAQGVYDISGSTIDLDHVSVEGDPSVRNGKDDSHAWWAHVTVPKASVTVGAPVFLDAQLAVRFRDSVPFVTLFARSTPLPGWVRGALGVEDVSGEAHLVLGDETLSIPAFVVRGGPFDVEMKLRRHREAYLGKLLARYRTLSVGVELLGPDTRVHVFGARDWYTTQPAP